MRNIQAIFIKQIQSYVKKPQLFITPLMFLGLAFVFTLFADGGEDAGYPWELVNQLSVMFLGIGTMMTASSFVWEDWGTMNLRFMSMAGVKSTQYLVATGGALIPISFIVLFLFGVIGGYMGNGMFIFLGLTMLGAVASILFGLTLALLPEKISPIAGSTLPFVVGFAPMISEGSDEVATIFYFLFTQQINVALDGFMEYGTDPTHSFYIVLANIGVILVAFAAIQIKNGPNWHK